MRRWPDVFLLVPEPAERFVELTRAIVERYPAYPPYEGVHDDVIPHLTVASRRPAPREIDSELQRRLPIAAHASAVVQLEEYEPDRRRERGRFVLGV